MTIDEIEGLARDSVEFHEEDLNSPNRREAQLARFILDVLPVLRAEVERLRGLLREAHRELSTIEAITVSPSDVDGLLDLIRRIREALK